MRRPLQDRPVLKVVAKLLLKEQGQARDAACQRQVLPSSYTKKGKVVRQSRLEALGCAARDIVRLPQVATLRLDCQPNYRLHGMQARPLEDEQSTRAQLTPGTLLLLAMVVYGSVTANAPERLNRAHPYPHGHPPGGGWFPSAAVPGHGP